jgi:predicted nucleic acid-binding protein
LIVGESAGPIDADMAFGLWIAVVLAAALAAGGFLLYREEMAGPA